jgi:hypothetical protein
MIENDDVAVSGTVARHREGTIDVPEPRHARALERNGRKHFAAARGIALELNDLYLHIVPHRVVGPDRSVHDAAVVELPVHIFQKVRRRHRRLRHVDLHRDRPELSLEDDHDGRHGRLPQERAQREDEKGHA